VSGKSDILLLGFDFLIAKLKTGPAVRVTPNKRALGTLQARMNGLNANNVGLSRVSCLHTTAFDAKTILSALSFSLINSLFATNGQKIRDRKITFVTPGSFLNQTRADECNFAVTLSELLLPWSS
jgi:hypothetical protein